MCVFASTALIVFGYSVFLCSFAPLCVLYATADAAATTTTRALVISELQTGKPAKRDLLMRTFAANCR